MTLEHKVVMLGTAGVGKSSVTLRFVQGFFVETYDPTIEDSYRREHLVDGQNYAVEIMDTAGTETFTAMREMYMREGESFILVYSITSKATLDALVGILEKVRLIKGEGVPVMLCGNKCDLEDERVVTRQEAQARAAEFSAGYTETSAKTAYNVDAMFTDLIRRWNEYRVSLSNRASADSSKNRSGSSCCCLL